VNREVYRKVRDIDLASQLLHSDLLGRMPGNKAKEEHQE
jgi:hypothetical protein